MKSWNSGWDSVRATWLDQLVIATSSIRCYLPPGLQYTRERGPLMTSHSSLLSPKQRNIHLFRKLLVGHCGAFLALLRLGGNETGDGGSGLYAGTAAPAACTGVPSQVQFLAQRLYGCISSVIAGDVDPGCLISVLEEFMLLDVCHVRVATRNRASCSACRLDSPVSDAWLCRRKHRLRTRCVLCELCCSVSRMCT